MTSPLIDEVRAEVAAREPVDDRERRSIARFLAESARLAQPFDRHADPTHVTGSAVVVGPRGVVLLEHKLLGIWLQPGGHVEGDEAPWDTAVREAREETGLDLVVPPADQAALGRARLVHVDVHTAARGHVHLDLRYLLAADGDPAPPPGESQNVRWFGWDEAITVADDGLVGALRALRPGPRRPAG